MFVLLQLARKAERPTSFAAPITLTFNLFTSANLTLGALNLANWTQTKQT
jgi:hypothetical protein